jgi:F-type H+-transporting ATPase subunit b
MEIKLYQLLFQFINFGILLFILAKFLYKPILKILDQRADRIDQGLLAAQKNLEEKEKLEQFKQAELVKVEKETAKLMADAKLDAQKLAQAVINEAKQKATLIMAKEEQAFKARMAEEERRFSLRLADMVSITTKSVLKDALTEKEQQAIIAHQLKELPKVKVN